MHVYEKNEVIGGLLRLGIPGTLARALMVVLGIAYAACVAEERALLFQNAEGDLMATVALTAEERASWLQKLDTCQSEN